MNLAVRELFSEIADLSASDRRRVLIERRVPVEVCAELESLLQHDVGSCDVDGALTRVLDEALLSAAGQLRCGPYRLIRRIGSGGMGDVYLAKRDDGEIDQQVAVKLLRYDTGRPEWRERFLRERQLLASLNHPAIARLMDAGHTADGQPYFVMELVDGIPVDEYASRLDLRSRLELFLLICAAVAHAHSHSIIHRDLKPSNILIEASGNPKLLDFGIAKLLPEPNDQTRTGERLLTPTYASPEQIRGSAQTVATDVFSLGAVLYKLITGRSPREQSPVSAEQAPQEDFRAPSRLKSNVSADLDSIVLKALRYEPAERYASVEAFAADIRSLLDSRPVEARRGNAVYRIRKLLRRQRTIAACTGVVVAALILAAGIARTQRAAAEDRLEKGRHLASTVLALDEVSGDIHGSSNARYQLVSLSKDYLEGLLTDARRDRRLALDVGRAYSLLARAQGISIAAPVGQAASAEDSLRQAATLVEPLVTGDPENRDALLAAARISHDRMLAAETNHRREEALAQGQRAVEELEMLLARGPLSPAQLETASEYFYQVAVTHKNLHRFEEAIQYSRRCVELARALPGGNLRIGVGLSLLADLYRDTGDLDRALETIREAHAHLKRARFPNDNARRSSWITLLWRQGKILGAAHGPSLNRTDDAIGVLEEAFDLIEEWCQNDANGAMSRLYFASVGRELGELLRVRHPRRALAVYDHSVLRLSMVLNNAEARRGQAVLLAGSAYPLRSLGNTAEAGRRIEAAFRILGEEGQVATPRTSRNTAAESLLRAKADHLVDTGKPQPAVQLYEEILGRFQTARLDPSRDLRHAVAVSETYAALAALYRRISMPERADALDSRRNSLWREWESRLPKRSVAQSPRELARAR